MAVDTKKLEQFVGQFVTVLGATGKARSRPCWSSR
jgi:hypothetical protein